MILRLPHQRYLQHWLPQDLRSPMIEDTAGEWKLIGGHLNFGSTVDSTPLPHRITQTNWYHFVATDQICQDCTSFWCNCHCTANERPSNQFDGAATDIKYFINAFRQWTDRAIVALIYHDICQIANLTSRDAQNQSTKFVPQNPYLTGSCCPIVRWSLVWKRFSNIPENNLTGTCPSPLTMTKSFYFRTFWCDAYLS